MSFNTMQLRRDSAATWVAVNPVLAAGEVGVDLTSGRLKVGNGVLSWISLPYFGVATTHTQAVAATTWTINHNLGYRPTVRPMTVGGAEMTAEILHASANQALVYFDSPTAGIAVYS